MNKFYNVVFLAVFINLTILDELSGAQSAKKNEIVPLISHIMEKIR